MTLKWSKYHSISLIICLSEMRCKWSKHIMQCWRNKRSSEDVRWRSFSESKAPQKILMIRFETKTWLMENQVKLSCFSKCSSGNMTAVILTFTWSKSVQIWQKKTREAAAEAGRFYNYTKRAFTGYTTKLSIRDRRQQQIESETAKFDHLEISFKLITQLTIIFLSVNVIHHVSISI